MAADLDITQAAAPLLRWNECEKEPHLFLWKGIMIGSAGSPIVLDSHYYQDQSQIGGNRGDPRKLKAATGNSGTVHSDIKLEKASQQ